MFDILLGGKFSNKCKDAIKRINSRVVPIRKKKQAMLRFLRKDVADLLAHGHDSNAFGRIDALIVEINHTYCYDMIEQYCEYMSKQLPSLQKQRECPQEAMEAVSTLIFAAARFPDLPELCDLRRVFTERYGCHMESSVNAEFVEKIQKKSFPLEKKLHLMQEIAEEYSINWDSKKFGNKISSPALPTVSPESQDKPKKGSSNDNSNETDQPSYKLPDGSNGSVTNVPHQEMTSRERGESNPRNITKKLQMETKDIHVMSSINNGRIHDSSKKTKKVFADEPKNVKPFYNDLLLPPDIKSKDRHNGMQKDEVNEIFTDNRSSRVQEVQNYNGMEKQTNGSIQSLSDKAAYKVPPYTKSKGSKNGTHVEEQHVDGLAHHRLSRVKEGVDPAAQERQQARPLNLNNDKATNMIPPYVISKVRSVAAPVDPIMEADRPTQDPASLGYGISSSDKDNLKADLFGDDEKPKPRSVRKKHSKVLAIDDVDVTNDDKLANETLTSKRKGCRSTITTDGGYNEQKIMDQKTRVSVADVDNAIGYGKLLIRIPSGQRRQQGSRESVVVYDGDCNEEEIMDKLLIHYSKKGMPSRASKTRTRAPPADHDFEALEHQINNKHKMVPPEAVHQRAVSLPPEPTGLTEVVKGPARASSMQPDLTSPKMEHVHPKLPDYDELAAQLIALRKR